MKRTYSTRQKKRDTLKKMADFWNLAKGRPLDLTNWSFHTALVYDMQFDPKIYNGTILAHTGCTDFSPWGKKRLF